MPPTEDEQAAADAAAAKETAAAEAAAAKAKEAEVEEEEFDKGRALATIKKQRESEAAAVKRASELAAKVKEFEDKDKTEAQRLAEAKDASASEAADAKAEVLRLRAAIKYGLDEEDLDLLGTGDEDQIEARAKRLAERSTKEGDEPARRPRERLRTGAQPTSDPDKTDPASLAAKVPRGW